MALSGRLARTASERLHVLLAETTDGFWVRVAAEGACARRGWPLAMSPADADVLLVCGSVGAVGSVGSELEREAIDAVWAQVPGPRARVVAGTPDRVVAALDDAALSYRDPLGQLRDRHARAGAGTPQDLDHGEMDHGKMDHGEMDHGEMDHGEMDMSGPGGIPLASGGPDRDGLEMDVLHLRLGPVLAWWPPELVVWCSLQGDVVVEVEVDLLPASPPSGVSCRSAVRRVDRAVGLLRLAGALGPAASLGLVRDGLMAGAPAGEVVGQARRVRQRLGRSVVLRWSLRGLGTVSEDARRAHGLPASVVGDVWDRLLRLLDHVVDDLDRAAASPTAGGGASVGRAVGGTVGAADAEEPGPLAAVLPDLLRGRELAEARLLVASLLGHAPGDSVDVGSRNVQESPHG